MESKYRIDGISEQKHCEYFYQWVKDHPRIDKYLIKNVNEGKRSWFVSKLLKSIGFKPGIPDYQYAEPNNKYCSLWIEMKRTELVGRKNPNKFQDQWLENLRDVGHYATYAYGYQHAIEILSAYIDGRL
jgi:hypothetical protein